MAPARRPSFWPSALFRALRFLYLLWGGLILFSVAAQESLRFPEFLWHFPWAIHALAHPLGRGLLVGLSLTLGLAALIEIWELVDNLLVRFLNDTDRRS